MLAISLALATMFVQLAVPATEVGCNIAVVQATGGCPTTSTNGGGVDISGAQSRPGSPGTPGSQNQNSTYDNPTTPSAPLPERDPCVAYENDRCIGYTLGRDQETETEDEPAIPAVTITDLVRFTPTPIAITAEPDNIGVAGMPANFVATASVQVQHGELFGFPLSVRFTPIAYDYSYGDDSTATVASAGQSWATLGLAQFTATPTSHAYAERGTYSASVTVRYAAEVDFGTGWLPISGELSSAGPPQQIRIFEAHTALVAYTCDERPDAAGC